MNKFSAIIKSMRLRTLPLSAGGVLLGILLAAADYRISFAAALLTVLTTVCLQILSNLSNELGDVLHGTDTSERLGPAYGLNGGVLSIPEMKRLVGLFVVLCCLSGLAMIRVSFGTFLSLEAIMLMLLGAAAISAALRYTLGRNPYGYRARGDIFVFLFFGLVAVCGAYFVVAHTFHPLLLLPGAAVGFFSVGVLNVNNIRDMATDAPNRVTVALKLGSRRARIYQTALVILGWAAMVVYCLLRFFDPWHYLFVLTLPLFVLHLRGVWRLDGRQLDKMLPLLVMASFLFCLLAGMGFVMFLA